MEGFHELQADVPGADDGRCFRFFILKKIKNPPEVFDGVEAEDAVLGGVDNREAVRMSPCGDQKFLVCFPAGLASFQVFDFDTVFFRKDSGGFSVDDDRNSPLVLETLGCEMDEIGCGGDIAGQDVGDTAGSVGDNPALVDDLDGGRRLSAFDLDCRRQAGGISTDNVVIRNRFLLIQKSGRNSSIPDPDVQAGMVNSSS